MKLIIALIKETHLEKVHEHLVEADIIRLTTSRASGHGRQEKIEIYRGRKYVPNLQPKIRLEIAVNDEFVKTTCDAISNAVKSFDDNSSEGAGEGKIFILPLEDCIRIRTGETGGKAV